MNKFKLFMENMIVYGIGGVISKIVPLIMVPIVTRLMPNSTYYGISDLSNTIISLASAIAVMGMYDAMYRMFFEKEDKDFKKDICSTTITYTIGASFVVSVLMVILKGPVAQLFMVIGSMRVWCIYVLWRHLSVRRIALYPHRQGVSGA